MNKDMNEFLEMLELVPEVKQVIAQVFESLSTMEQEWCTALEFFSNTQVHVIATVYNGLIENGIDKEHALPLTLEAIRNIKTAALNGLLLSQK